MLVLGAPTYRKVVGALMDSLKYHTVLMLATEASNPLEVPPIPDTGIEFFQSATVAPDTAEDISRSVALAGTYRCMVTFPVMVAPVGMVAIRAVEEALDKRTVVEEPELYLALVP
ncbi:MAG: hypothetical protein K2Q22_05880, partial [Cytophagales bacterium]|nr:hypothetical protein [Cytophagales bacterium]